MYELLLTIFKRYKLYVSIYLKKYVAINKMQNGLINRL